MRKVIIQICVLLIFLIFSSNCFSQDKIYKNDGSIITAKILEINTETITYKKSNYLEGPSYVIEKKDVKRILLKNGDIEEYSSYHSCDGDKLNSLYENNYVIVPEKNCIISLVPFFKYEVYLMIEFLDTTSKVLNSHVDSFHIYFKNKAKNDYAIHASKKNNNTFYAIYRINSPASFTRLKRFRDYQIQMINIKTKSGYYDIPISKEISDKINKMALKLFPVDIFE
jgi:hypothetical protein